MHCPHLGRENGYRNRLSKGPVSHAKSRVIPKAVLFIELSYSQERDRFVVATKVRFPMDLSNPNAVGLSRRHITQSVEQSLQRLQTDHIDLLQVRRESGVTAC